MKKLAALTAPLLLLLVASVNAQSDPTTSDDELSLTIAALDHELFDAYNRCDLEKFGTFFVDDVEFYHDQTGLAIGKASLIESLKNNICGKVRREIVPGTLEVYPMHGYGAVEIGIHRFHQPAEQSTPTGEAKFIHLWQNQDGAWKITRVISYDHGPPTE